MSDVGDEGRPIIGDFGFSKLLKEGQTCSKYCGTKGYMAPEILERQPYSFPVDIWSFGVMLYVLVAGHKPFPYPKEGLTKTTLSNYATLLHKTKLKFDGEQWVLISDEFKDLLSGMLEKNQAKRITIDAVLQHPWFSQ